MKLISESEYNRLTQRKEELPVERSVAGFLDTDSSAKEILNSDDIPDDIKLQVYGSLLKHLTSEYQSLVDKPIKVKLDSSASSKLQNKAYIDDVKRNSSSGSSSSSDDENEKSALSRKDQELLLPIPEAFKRSALLILKRLKRHPLTITWDQHGRVKFGNGDDFASNVNISDLISAAVRPNLKFDSMTGPPGFTRFKLVLLKLNIPLSLVTPAVRRAILKVSTLPSSSPTLSTSAAASTATAILNQEQSSSNPRPSVNVPSVLLNWEPLSTFK